MTNAIVSLLLLSLSLVPQQQVHTYQNVAIYSSDGYIIDEDGEQFDIDFDIPNETTILVTYDNKNTVTRKDDVPIAYEILK